MFVYYIFMTNGRSWKFSRFVAGAKTFVYGPNESVWAIPGTLDPTED